MLMLATHGGLAQAPQAAAPSRDDELRDRVRALEQVVRTLEEDRARMKAAAATSQAAQEQEISSLRAEVSDLKARHPEDAESDWRMSLDASIAEATAKTPQVLARPWFENWHFSGFAAVGWVGTGSAGARPGKGFVVHEATLYLDAEVWGDISVLAEIKAVGNGYDQYAGLHTGEIYVNFRDAWSCRGHRVGFKVGRFDLPFGEEYLYEDANKNSLITLSAPYPWGFDEGVMAYGSCGNYGWVASVTDGFEARSIDDDDDKAINVKLYGRPCPKLYVSASGMRNGRTTETALWLGGVYLEAVEDEKKKAEGYGGREEEHRPLDDVWLYELDARYEFCDKGYLWGAFGQAFLDDSAGDDYDRTLTWFIVEGRWNVCRKIYVAGRYSEIGTYDADEGYILGGDLVTNGAADFGFDTRRYTRLSLGLGWTPNPRTTFKVEVGRDWFQLIDGADHPTHNGARWFAGVEAVVTF